MEVTVKAKWDDEANVWVAESEDVPGLGTEAPSSEALLQKLTILIPELLEANHCLPVGEEFVNVLVQSHRQAKGR